MTLLQEALLGRKRPLRMPLHVPSKSRSELRLSDAAQKKEAHNASTGPSMQSVGALPTDTSPWAVHQPAAQAVRRLGSVLCEAAPLGSGPSEIRSHTRCDQFTARMPALGPTRPILHRTSGQAARAGLSRLASEAERWPWGGVAAMATAPGVVRWRVKGVFTVVRSWHWTVKPSPAPLGGAW